MRKNDVMTKSATINGYHVSTFNKHFIEREKPNSLAAFILYWRRCINCENTNYQAQCINFPTEYWKVKVNKVNIDLCNWSPPSFHCFGNCSTWTNPNIFFWPPCQYFGNPMIIRVSCLDILYRYSLSKMFKSVQFSPVQKNGYLKWIEDYVLLGIKDLGYVITTMITSRINNSIYLLLCHFWHLNWFYTIWYVVWHPFNLF